MRRTKFYIYCRFKRLDALGKPIHSQRNHSLEVVSLETFRDGPRYMGVLHFLDGSRSRPFRMDKPSFLSRTASNYKRFEWALERDGYS